LKAYYLGDANNPAIASSVLTEQVKTVPGTAFKSGASYPVPYQDAYYQSIAAADFNGDGKADLIVAGQNADPGGIGTVSILIGNGDGTFQPAVSYTFGTSTTSVVVAGFQRRRQDGCLRRQPFHSGSYRGVTW
jgi:hypothetical protein